MNLARMLRHLATSPLTVKRAFPVTALAAIEQAIREAERSHAGEIRFALEGALELGAHDIIVRPIDEDGREVGGHLVAADAVGAGLDEVVLVASGSSARQTGATDKRPIDAVVMAIVDSWSVGAEVKYKK